MHSPFPAACPASFVGGVGGSLQSFTCLRCVSLYFLFFLSGPVAAPATAPRCRGARAPTAATAMPSN